MALFKIFKGLSSNFGKEGNPTNETKEGFAYFTPDDGKFFIDVTSGETPRLGTSTKFGANRIWINSGNLDELIFDCGTAFGWTEHRISFINAGNSIINNTPDSYVTWTFGDSDIVYDAGSSLY